VILWRREREAGIQAFSLLPTNLLPDYAKILESMTGINELYRDRIIHGRYYFSCARERYFNEKFRPPEIYLW
jgi:hypothetical protein